MRTVQAIIDAGGGLDRLTHISIENPPWMRLVIESIGTGPRGHPMVSVAHYYEQAGDALVDPEVTFEVDGDAWHPLTYQQDNLGYYAEAVSLADDGRVEVHPVVLAGLREFCEAWNRDMAEQGYAEAARGNRSE